MMIYRRFFIVAATIALIGLAIGVLTLTKSFALDIQIGQTYFIVSISKLLIALTFIFVVPGFFFWLLENYLNCALPQRLVRIQFLLLSVGTLLVLVVMSMLCFENLVSVDAPEILYLFNGLVIAAVVLILSGLCLLPAALWMSLKKI